MLEPQSEITEELTWHHCYTLSSAELATGHMRSQKPLAQTRQGQVLWNQLERKTLTPPMGTVWTPNTPGGIWMLLVLCES